MTKIKLILLLCFFVQLRVNAQVKIGDNPNTINNASLLELETTNKGFVPPRVPLTSLSSTLPLPTGLIIGTVVFNTTAGVGTGVGLYYWNGTAWVAVGASAASTAWSLTGNAGTNSGTNFLGTTDNVSIRFRTNGTERMVIDSNGRVGIGTRSPLNALSVIATNPLYLSGIQATSTVTTDSVLTINAGVVKKTPFAAFADSGWRTQGNDNTTVNSTSFLGTKTGTAIPLMFRVGGDTAGYLGLKTSSNAVSFGIGASGAATTVSSVAIGAGAKATGGNEAVALGSNAVAGSFHDIAIGAGATTATFSSNIAIGATAKATSANAIALGSNAEASTNQIALAIGVSSLSTGFASMAIGNGAKSTNSNTTAFGALALASGVSANAFGNRSNATGDSSLAVGNISVASKSNSIVVGNSSTAAGAYSNVFGTNSSTTGDSTIVIGNNLTVPTANVLILGSASKKIGMGTITPQEKVDIVGNVRFSGALMPNGIAGTTGQILTSAGAGVPPTWQSAASASWLLTGNTGTKPNTNFIGTIDTAALVIRTNNTERMRILGTVNGSSSAGWIGMGVNPPRSPVDMAGNFTNKNILTLQNTSSTGYTSVDLFDNTGALSGTFGYANPGVTNTSINGRDYFFIYDRDFLIGTTSNNNGVLYIQNGGNIGINTNTPSQRLDVVGNMELNGAFMPAGDAGTNGEVLTSKGALNPPIWAAGVTKIKGSVTLDPGTIAANSTNQVQINNLTGFPQTSTVILNPRTQLPPGFAIAFCYVSAANQITVGILNARTSSGSPGAITYDVTVLP